MELQERINVLIQGVELAQKNGVLTLDDAYLAKQAVDALKNNVSLKEAFAIMTKMVNLGQKKGIYSLRDSHFLYLALENYESVIVTPPPTPAPQVSAPAQPAAQPAPVPAQPATHTTGRKTKKES